MALVAAVIVVSSILADRVWNAQLRGQFDESMGEEVKEFVAAAASLQSEQEVASFAEEYLRLHQYEEPTRMFLFDLADRNALTLHAPADGEIFQGDLPQPQRDAISLRTVRSANGEPYRVALAPVTVAGRQVGTIYVAEPVAPVETIIDEHIRNTALAALGGLAVAGIGAYLIARTSLAPVRRITRAAKSITQKDLSGRIGYEGPRDEVGELASAFDNMIGRLDQAFREQRRLLTDLSHELRTPITIVRGHLDLLHSAADRSSPEAEESINAALEELDRVNRLVADLLLLARSSSSDFLRRSPLSLRPLMQEIMTNAHRLGDRRWVIGDVPECVVVADKDHITGAFLSLFQNAVQHTEPDDSIGLHATLKDGWVSLKVWDTGEGIPPEDLPNVFERFYRVRKPGDGGSEGVGLGLSIVKAVVNAHGGTVDVDSQPGKGSVFTIRLPVYNASPQGPSLYD
ncbi:MAG: sensor histidine kinase [Dehalococcoidia bacterium]